MLADKPKDYNYLDNKQREHQRHQAILQQPHEQDEDEAEGSDQQDGYDYVQDMEDDQNEDMDHEQHEGHDNNQETPDRQIGNLFTSYTLS
jgi:hypothetical protein